MAKCRHLILSPEAYAIGPSGESQAPIDVSLCEWPDQHPERFVNAPMWLLKLIGAGLAVRPEHDCVGCPGFKLKEPARA